MRKRIFGQSEHLEDVAPEYALGHVEINLLEVGAHDLLAGVVYQNINGSESELIN